VDHPHTPLQAYSKLEREHAINWFDTTFATRLNNKKKGAIVVIMQRLHQYDLSGHLLSKKLWHHVKIPVISDHDQVFTVGDFVYQYPPGELLCKARDGPEEIEQIKLEIGSAAFNAQYQQNPLSSELCIIKQPWLVHEEFKLEGFEQIYQSWDCASKEGAKNDYSACTIWGVRNNKYYLINVIREKLSFPELKKRGIQSIETCLPNAVLIEDKSAGQSLIQELKVTTRTSIIPINPKHDKFTRMLSVCACLREVL